MLSAEIDPSQATNSLVVASPSKKRVVCNNHVISQCLQEIKYAAFESSPKKPYVPVSPIRVSSNQLYDMQLSLITAGISPHTMKIFVVGSNILTDELHVILATRDAETSRVLANLNFGHVVHFTALQPLAGNDLTSCLSSPHTAKAAYFTSGMDAATCRAVAEETLLPHVIPTVETLYPPTGVLHPGSKSSNLYGWCLDTDAKGQGPLTVRL
jgi:hypothetical protein